MFHKYFHAGAGGVLEAITQNAGCEMHKGKSVPVHSKIRLALTLALSPRRGNHQWRRRKNALTGGPFPALEKVLPLLEGEGRGEGEVEF